MAITEVRFLFPNERGIPSEVTRRLVFFLFRQAFCIALLAGCVSTARLDGPLSRHHEVRADGTYSFSYESDDGSYRSESRDADGRVVVKYGYVNPSASAPFVALSSAAQAKPITRNGPTDVEDEERFLAFDVSRLKGRGICQA